MINLLPPSTKQDYAYARHNVRLIRWVIVLAIALVGLLAIGTGGLIYMNNQSSDYEQQISRQQKSLQAQNIKQVQAEAKDISGSLKLAVQVLSKEVLFSKLLEQLATITPSGAVLSALNIGETNGALNITAQTTDYNAATQLQVNLADPANQIFDSADIVSINCGQASDKPTNYPCTVNITAQFSKDKSNPFLFINQGANS